MTPHDLRAPFGRHSWDLATISVPFAAIARMENRRPPAVLFGLDELRPLWRARLVALRTLTSDDVGLRSAKVARLLGRRARARRRTLQASGEGRSRAGKNACAPVCARPVNQRVNVAQCLEQAWQAEVDQVANTTLNSIWMPLLPCMSMRGPRDVERIAATGEHDERDQPLGRLALIHQPPSTLERGLEAKRDLGLHVGELLLEELGLHERRAELLVVKPWRAGAPAPAILRRAHRASRLCQRGACSAGLCRQPFRAGDVGQERTLRRFLHCPSRPRRHRGTRQAELALDLGRGEALHALSRMKPRILVAVMRDFAQTTKHRRRSALLIHIFEPVSIAAAVDLLGLRDRRRPDRRLRSGLGGARSSHGPGRARVPAGHLRCWPNRHRRGSGMPPAKLCTAHHRAEAGIDLLDLARVEAAETWPAPAQPNSSGKRHPDDARLHLDQPEQPGVGLFLEVGLRDARSSTRGEVCAVGRGSSARPR